MCGTQSISLRGTRGLATTLSTRALRAVSRVVYRLFLPRAVGAISRQPGRSLAASALLFTPMHPSAYKLAAAGGACVGAVGGGGGALGHVRARTVLGRAVAGRGDGGIYLRVRSLSS